MKGLNINGAATARGVADAHANGARLLRYQILPGLNIPPEHWDTHISSVIAHLDTVVFPNIGPAKLILDMHSAPGGMKGKKLRMFSDPVCMQAFRAGWYRLIQHFDTYPPLLGYGVINEPAGSAKEVAELHRDFINRAITSKVVTITAPRCTPGNFSDTIFLGSGRWYEVHFYEPMKLTHQGAMGYKKGRRYPSRSFNKSHMIKACRPMLRFQQKHNAQIFVGEFGICSFADVDSRANWMRDAISLWDSWDWHWAAHCWREGPGSIWSYEGYPQIMGPIHASLGSQ